MSVRWKRGVWTMTDKRDGLNDVGGTADGEHIQAGVVSLPRTVPIRSRGAADGPRQTITYASATIGLPRVAFVIAITTMQS